jgi:hypothetical protein
VGCVPVRWENRFRCRGGGMEVAERYSGTGRPCCSSKKLVCPSLAGRRSARPPRGKSAAAQVPSGSRHSRMAHSLLRTGSRGDHRGGGESRANISDGLPPRRRPATWWLTASSVYSPPAHRVRPLKRPPTLRRRLWGRRTWFVSLLIWAEPVESNSLRSTRCCPSGNRGGKSHRSRLAGGRSPLVTVIH